MSSTFIYIRTGRTLYEEWVEMAVLWRQLSASAVLFWAFQLCSQICIPPSTGFLNGGFISISGRRILPCMGLSSCFITPLPPYPQCLLPAILISTTKLATLISECLGLGWGWGVCDWIENVCLSCPLGEPSPTPNYFNIVFLFISCTMYHKRSLDMYNKTVFV